MGEKMLGIINVMGSFFFLKKVIGYCLLVVLLFGGCY